MNTYIVIGQIGYCIYGLWTEIAVSIEVEATDADAARDRVLATHQTTAERQDAYATVVWEQQPSVQPILALAWAA